MSDLILPAVTQFRFNSDMLSLGLSDISPEDAVRRWRDGEGSSISYVTGHITSSRYGLLKLLEAPWIRPAETKWDWCNWILPVVLHWNRYKPTNLVDPPQPRLLPLQYQRHRRHQVLPVVLR